MQLKGSFDRGTQRLFSVKYLFGEADAGVDPGFFLGGGALVSCSTSTPIKHIVFFLHNTNCIKKTAGDLGGGCAPPAPSP